jgi:hypothetical protein
MEKMFDRNTTLMLLIPLIILLIVVIFVIVSRNKKVNIATPHAMNFTSTSPDATEWLGYYTFNYNYFLKLNAENRIIGDAINVGNDTYILTIIPAASDCSVGDWILLKCETVSNDNDVYTYIFENSPVPTNFNQVYAYHSIGDDSPSVHLEVIDDGGKRWVMFGGYNDI